MFIYDHSVLIIINNFLWFHQLSLFESCRASQASRMKKTISPSHCLFHRAVYHHQMTALAATFLCGTRVKLQDSLVSLL